MTALTRAKPVTRKQIDYLSRLIRKVGKKEYQNAKGRLGFRRKTIMRLTKQEASQLIDQLLAGGVQS